MFCRQCGREFPNTSPSCPNCGTVNHNTNGSGNKNTSASTAKNKKSAFKIKKKKSFIKTVIAVSAAIVIIAASFGIFSLVNYIKYTPYREMLSSLKDGFIYYQEYEEISRLRFYEYTENLNFFEKVLNIKKNCQVKINPEIYFLYDENAVEKNEELKDLIYEEADAEIYNEIPDICELILENGEAELVYQNEIIFYINTNENNEAVSVTYNKPADENQKEFINSASDTELFNKHFDIKMDYAYYKERTTVAESLLYDIIETASLDYAYNTFRLTDFIYSRFDNPNIKIEAHRTDEHIYLITVSGNCLFTLHSYDRPYRREAAVVFGYDISEKECYVYNDRDDAFEWYYYSKILD